MKFIVRTNLFGYKKMLSELNGAKLNPRVNQQDQKETRKSARPKIFTSLFGKNKQKNLLPNQIRPFEKNSLGDITNFC